MKRFAFVSAACALLMACTGSGTVTYGSSYPSYDPTIPRQLRAAGPVEVTLTGSPYAAADVVRAMNALPNVHQLTFAPSANPAQYGYRIAINFVSNTSNPCVSDAGNSMPIGNDASRLQAVGGFCRYGGMLARTTAYAPRPADPDSPEFRDFLHTLLVQLMPTFKPQGVENGDCPNRPNC